MPDGWEADHKLNPVANDARIYADADLYSNLREYLSGTDCQDDQDIPAIFADVDGDADGYDLSMLVSEVGRDHCDTLPCDFDLDLNGDVEDVDIFLFSEDYGRIN